MDKKIYLKILLLLAIIAIILFFLFQKYSSSLKSPANIKNAIKPVITIIKEPKAEDTADSKIYYTDLEYDPKTNIVKQAQVGLINSAIPQLTTLKEPNQESNYFIYRIKVADQQNKTIHEGYISSLKKIITMPNGNYLLRIKSLYRPGASIELFNEDNKLLWKKTIENVKT